MTTPQPGIFALGTRHQHHLELDLRPGADLTDLRAALARIREPKVAGGAANLVLAFGPDLWARLAGPDGPEVPSLVPLEGPAGDRVPVTQHDLYAWVHGSGADDIIDTAMAVVAALAPVAEVVTDRRSFVYRDSRDMTGFVDGTANPSPTEAPGVACIPDGEPGAGGAHVLLQLWAHDLDRFGALEVDEQERVFGRTKADSTALPRDVRPADAHITVAEIHDEAGEELPIYRRSTPVATAQEQGLCFLAFSPDQERFTRMLTRMVGLGDSPRDRLLDFTEARASAAYFAPSLDDLVALGVTG